MAVFTLEEICLATGAQSDKVAACSFAGVCTDTRKIRPGDLYIALWR